MGDLRTAARLLGRNPAFTIVAILTLALGVGANTAVFSLLKAVLLDPLPYHEPDRLVTITEREPDEPDNSPYDYTTADALRRCSWSLQSLSSYRDCLGVLTESGEPGNGARPARRLRLLRHGWRQDAVRPRFRP